MWNLQNLRAKLLGYRIDPDELEAYRSVIPNEVDMHIESDGHTFIATVTSIDGHKPDSDFLITEASNRDELVTMINDLVLTYVHVPEIYRPYFKRALKLKGQHNKNDSLTVVKA